MRKATEHNLCYNPLQVQGQGVKKESITQAVPLLGKQRQCSPNREQWNFSKVSLEATAIWQVRTAPLTYQSRLHTLPAITV